MTQVLMLVLGLAIGTVAPMLAVAQEAAPAASQSAIAVDNRIDDSEIRSRIRAILDQIGGFERVTVEVSEGAVRLDGSVAESTAIDEVGTIVGRVDSVVTIRNRVETTADVSDRPEPVIDRLTDRAGRALGLLPLVLVALTAFAVIALFGIWATRPRGVWYRIAPNRFIGDIYRRVVQLAFLLAAVVLSLDMLGATALLGTVLGAAGLIGLAVGFAVRDTVENFIASIMLSLRQPFRPNDLVEIEGDLGFVLRLSSRATVLLSPDGNQIRTPNARVFKARIINFSSQPKRRFLFELGINSEADLVAARKTSLGTLRSLPFVLDDPRADAWIEDVGDSNVVMTFTGRVNQTDTNLAVARGEAIRVTKSALEIAGFGLPESIYRLRFDDVLPVDPRAPATCRISVRPSTVIAETAAASEDVSADHSVSLRAAKERAEHADRCDLLSESGAFAE